MEIKKFKPQNHKIKAVIYGASGSGKTTFGATAPNPVFASAESGLLSIAEKGVDYAQINTLKDLGDLLSYLQKGDHKFDSVVIDSITEINDIIKMEIEERKGRSMQLQDWQEVSKSIKKILRGFRDLDMHVIFIAQEVNVMDEDKINKVVPSLNGKAATEIAYFMDIVGYIYIDKAGEHVVETDPSHRLLTKDRSKKIGNDTEPNFATWEEKISSIETGKEEVIASHKQEPEQSEKPPEPKSKDKAEPKITKNQTGEIMKLWDEMYDLLKESQPETYADEVKDSKRRDTMKNQFGKDSTTKLTKKEANQFIEKLQNKINSMKENEPKEKNEQSEQPENEQEPEQTQIEDTQSQ